MVVENNLTVKICEIANHAYCDIPVDILIYDSIIFSYSNNIVGNQKIPPSTFILKFTHTFAQIQVSHP